MLNSFRRLAQGALLTLCLGPLALWSGAARAEDPPLAVQLPDRIPVPDGPSPLMKPPAVDMLATIRSRGVLKVGVVPGAPMVMKDAQGEYQGYSVALARRLAEDLGVTVEFVETDWTLLVADLLAQHFDLAMSGVWVTLPRALVVNFTTPTLEEGIYLIASKKAAAALRSREDFNRAGVKIVVYAGTLQAHLAPKLFPKATIVTVEGDADHLQPVLRGEAQAALVPTLSPQAVVHSAPARLWLPMAQPVASAAAAMAVRKGDPDFLTFLNTWLELQRREGLLDEQQRFWGDGR